MKLSILFCAVMSWSLLASSPYPNRRNEKATLEAPRAVDGWEMIDNKDGIKVFKKEVKDSPLVAFKGSGVIDASIDKVTSVLYDMNRKKEWVHRMADAKIVKQISDLERIEYNHTNTPWPLADRDFVFHAKLIPLKDGSVRITLKSVNSATMPKQDSIVRARLMNSSYLLQKVAENKTKLTVEIHADPMGIVPAFLVNIFQKKWPLRTLQGIRKQVSRSDFKVHPTIQKLRL